MLIPIERWQSVGEREVADVPPRFDPVLDGGTEVNTRVNARLAVLGSRWGQAGKRPRQTGKRDAACDRNRLFFMFLVLSFPVRENQAIILLTSVLSAISQLAPMFQ